MAEPSERYIPVECTFLAGGEVVRDFVYFKRWVTYRITTVDGHKAKLSVAAEDGSERFTLVGVTARYAVPKLRHFGVTVTSPDIKDKTP